MTTNTDALLYTTIGEAQMLALEEAAFAAWPAAEIAPLSGWRLRAADGETKRANSVWAAQLDGELALEERIAAVEDFYAERSLPACFQLTSAVRPRDLDGHLAQRGYQVDSPTLVQSAPLTTILQRTPSLRTFPHLEIEINEEFDEGWFAVYEANENHDSKRAGGRSAILKRTPSPSAFVSAYINNVRVAVGLGLITGDHFGIFCMSTAPTARRRGAAIAMLRVVAIWAQMMEAKVAYLQVVAGNIAARALYERAGFTTAYNYHYRIRTREPAEGASA